jgi:hypothetical protein
MDVCDDSLILVGSINTHIQFPNEALGVACKMKNAPRRNPISKYNMLHN